jgi:hypothetical protein
MANILPKEKQVAVIGALGECMSIRAIERLTGVHRDTIMRLGVRVGEGCAKMLDQKMRDLTCTAIELMKFGDSSERNRLTPAFRNGPKDLEIVGRS